MKTSFTWVHRPVTIASIGLWMMLGSRATAQTFINLHSFALSKINSLGNSTNIGGAEPQASLIVSGSTLFGTAVYSGKFGGGTIFAVNIDGAGFMTIHDFDAAIGNLRTNSGGFAPSGELVLSGNTLYGTAPEGGISGHGTVFSVNTNGTGFTTLHDFSAVNVNNANSDGASPISGLILLGDTLFGTAAAGGSASYGAVFSVNTDGTGFKNLHNFTGASATGITPLGGLTVVDGRLYGTTFGGGSGLNGTIFGINTNGSGFTTLHSFTPRKFNSAGYSTNSDGAYPYGRLISSSNTLYGTASQCGVWASGTVFAIHTTGQGFTNIHSFSFLDDNLGTNSDGAFPRSGLALFGHTLYGSAVSGGKFRWGSLFALNTNDATFTVLHNFTPPSGATPGNDGAGVNGDFIFSGSTLYGTAAADGNSIDGTVFSLSLPSPPLTLIASAENLVLTWPKSILTYNLQSTANLSEPTIWTSSPAPFLVNGRNTVTNPISETAQFFRLSD